MKKAIMGEWVLLIATAALLVWLPVAAGDDRGFVQEVITLKADDGVSVPALLNYPSAGINTHSPAVIYYHGIGGSPVQALGAPRFVAEPLAAKGYTGLSILSRHSAGHINMPFGKATLDVKAAVDWLSRMGMSDIILVGHSLGSIRITRYWIDTRDARIKAMIHYAPTRDMPEWARAGFGEERYRQIVDRLSMLVSEGRGDEYVFDTFEMPPPAPPGIERGFLQSAATWLDWWGPAARTRNSVGFAELDMPLLLVSGDADAFVTRDYQDSLRTAAVQSPRVDSLWYEGVDHIFTGARERAAQDAYDWLKEIGLGPRARVSTQVVDTTATDGVEQSGILYQPDSGDDYSKPAFLLLYGYSGDNMHAASHWLPVRLAQAGYSALAGRNRAAGAAIPGSSGSCTWRQPGMGRIGPGAHWANRPMTVSWQKRKPWSPPETGTGKSFMPKV